MIQLDLLARREPNGQSAEILRHLQGGAAITALEALELYGCMRLAARIADLRDMGYVIDTIRRHLPPGKVIAAYRLVA